MTRDPFEQQLAALARTQPRCDPTPAWKCEILTYAKSRAQIRPPRWMTYPLAAAWLVVLILEISRPALPNQSASRAPLPVTPWLLASRQTLQTELNLP